MAKKEKMILKDGVYYYKNGWKQRIGRMTKVYVKGTDHERGIQFGTLLAREIKETFACYLAYVIAAGTGVPRFFNRLSRWLPFSVKPLLFLLYRKKIQKRIEKYPEWVLKELEGMARGAKIHPFFLKFMNTLSDDVHALGCRDLEALKVKSCCSFAFTGRDGTIYHGKNLDWVVVEGFIQRFCFQQREDEKGDSFCIIGAPGVLNTYEFGMNSHGISIALTGRFYRGKRAANLVLTNAAELQILRYGKNFKHIQKLYNTKTGFNRTDALLIGSAHDRDYKLFEVTPRGVAMTDASDGKLFNTNTYVHPVFRKHNRHWGTIYDNRFCDPRYIRLRELMARHPAALEDAFHLLADTFQPGFEHKTFLGQATVNRFITNVSALMVHGPNPGVWIARDHTYAAFSQYTFFDYSPKPQTKERIRPPNDIIFTAIFKNFKELMHLRDSRYYVSPGKIAAGAKKLLAKEPDNPIFILFLAQHHLKYGQVHQALSLLNRHPLPWCADYRYGLGQCCKRLNRLEEAREHFAAAKTLPSIEGFPQMVEMICLIQQVKINTMLGLTHDDDEVKQLKNHIEKMQSKFATPNIGMPDYPYINNIVEPLEEIML